MNTRALIAGVSLLVPALAASQGKSPAAAFQIAAAVSPLPENLRAGARVLGYDAAGKLVTLRPGTNQMTCLADDPSAKMFHVACYHSSLEPFMSRGRALHALKKSKESIDSTRLREIQAGRYAMPARQAALYQYFAQRDSVDVNSGLISGAEYLYVVYVPYATYKSTGITEAPIEGGPWIMDPGKPWAHLMIQPPRSSRVQINVK